MNNRQTLRWTSCAMFGLAGLNAAHAQKACDRDCLKSAADSYIAAMVAHDARKAPLAGNFLLVENLARTDTRSGLWSSISAAPGEFRIYVPDVKAQQIGYIGVMQANGKPAMLGLRLKMTGDKVSEA
jgi:hypothetical protein